MRVSDAGKGNMTEGGSELAMGGPGGQICLSCTDVGSSIVRDIHKYSLFFISFILVLTIIPSH